MVDGEKPGYQNGEAENEEWRESRKIRYRTEKCPLEKM